MFYYFFFFKKDDQYLISSAINQLPLLDFPTNIFDGSSFFRKKKLIKS